MEEEEEEQAEVEEEEEGDEGFLRMHLRLPESVTRVTVRYYFSSMATRLQLRL